VQFSPTEISVKGPLGTLKQSLSDQVKLEKVENRLQFAVANESHAANALSGTITQIDTSTDKVLRTIPVGNHPLGITFIQ